MKVVNSKYGFGVVEWANREFDVINITYLIPLSSLNQIDFQVFYPIPSTYRISLNQQRLII